MPHLLPNPPTLTDDPSVSSRQSVDDALRHGIQRGVHLALTEVDDLGQLLRRLPARAEDHQNHDAYSLLFDAHTESVRILLLLREIASLLGSSQTVAAAHERRRAAEATRGESQRLLRAVTSEFARTGSSAHPA